MSAPFEPRSAVRRGGPDSILSLALRCARNVYNATDRRTPEARALAAWLCQSTAALGLPDTTAPDDDALDRAKRRGVAVQDWRKIGVALEGPQTCLQGRRHVAPIGRWIEAITETLLLDPLEAEIFDLALHYRLDKRVERLFDVLSECRGGRMRLNRDAALIALLLDAPTADVDVRLTPDARLQASGLLRHQNHGELDVLERLTALLRRNILPAVDLYDQLLGTMTGEPLPWDAFTHLSREAEVAAAVLRAAITGQENGVNILLYGPPGTGKTSFAATLATQVGIRLRPVAEADEEGGEPSREERLASLRLALRLAPMRNTLLLFDEAEDLFARRGTALDESAMNSRAYIHRLLERTAVPVIWTANDISMLGPAVLRRMTMCVELKVPDLVTRTRLWRQMGEEHGVQLSDADAGRLARLVPAAPAIASTALRAAHLAGGGAETARVVVEGIARAVSGGSSPAPEPERDTTYDPALVNADYDLARLTARLARPGADCAVSFLLSGPTGSGKSAWVRYLADRMGLPVVQKRASDILDAFLGGSERNIANAFVEARDINAFLVFDEADSLLPDRAHAVRSWEVSQVNEMLTWMEQHKLPFACTTNLPERLDRASLRRFVMKIRFNWLTQAQVRLAFRHFFGLTPPPVMDGLRTLTPADFALVRRQAAAVDAATAEELARLLTAESEGRIGGRLAVGFAAKVHNDGGGG